MTSHVKQLINPETAAGEVFVTLVANETDDIARLIETGAGILGDCGARLVRERLFVPTGKLTAYQFASKRVFVTPHARAELHAGSNGVAGGVQLHGVVSGSELAPLEDDDGKVHGVALSGDNTKWAFTSAITQPLGDGPQQTRDCFEVADRILRRVGMTLHDVARTWIYLDEILSWYRQFNEARNAVFVERELLRRGEDPSNVRVPASTGMGVRPVPAAKISLEVIAVSGDNAQLRKRAAAGVQRSAFEYGSAFARAAECRSLAGRTVYVSGTAAIDPSGTTCHKEDASGQIRMTLENVCAALASSKSSPQNVVEAIAYCKSPEIASHFCQSWRKEVPWPWLIVVGDVCREDLLFEVEVTAVEAQL